MGGWRGPGGVCKVRTTPLLWSPEVCKVGALTFVDAALWCSPGSPEPWGARVPRAVLLAWSTSVPRCVRARVGPRLRLCCSPSSPGHWCSSFTWVWPGFGGVCCSACRSSWGLGLRGSLSGLPVWGGCPSGRVSASFVGATVHPARRSPFVVGCGLCGWLVSGGGVFGFLVFLVFVVVGCVGVVTGGWWLVGCVVCGLGVSGVRAGVPSARVCDGGGHAWCGGVPGVGGAEGAAGSQRWVPLTGGQADAGRTTPTGWTGWRGPARYGWSVPIG